MAKLHTILEKFLKDAGSLKSPQLGDEVPLRNQEVDKVAFIEVLSKERGFNRGIIIALVGLHVVLFVVGIGFAAYYRDSPPTIGVILGGSILSLLAITKSLQQVWREKTIMDVLLTSVPNLSGESIVKIIESIYYEKR
ncbi:MAG: hypothetical protein IPP12_21105 [Nitrospira sp.]|nr:hypothetical protein [Nitrospira sp.]